MTCKILSTIQKYNMLQRSQCIAVGVSGGADSVCLLHFLSSIKDEYDIVLKAVHINHNIRGDEAKRDEEFVRLLCKKLDVEFNLFSVDVPKLSAGLGISEEECGRNVRYECFNKVGADKIAVAHTLSDSAETLLFNLARGTGLKGVCGIPPIRDNIIRPLIECTRDEIENYCSSNLLQYVTDSTNLETEYTRNKIRHNIIPMLKQINPSFEKSVLRFTKTAYLENSYMDKCANQLLNFAKSGNSYKRDVLINADFSVMKRAVAQALSVVMNKDVEDRHIELCCEIIQKGKGAVQLSKDIYMVCERELVSIKNADKDVALEEWCIPIKRRETFVNGKTFIVDCCSADDVPKEDIYNAVCIDDIDISKLSFRSRKAGDKFSDIRRKNTKSLKKLFIESKIPASERNGIAVLCYGDSVLYVEKFGTDAKYIINKNSKKALIVRVKEV